MDRPKIQLGLVLFLAWCAWGISHLGSVDAVRTAHGAPFTGGGGRSDPFASESSSSARLGMLREWTDVKGRKLVARFAEMDGDKVVLDRDGKPARVNFDTLSAADQLYVLKVLKDRGESRSPSRGPTSDVAEDKEDSFEVMPPSNASPSKSAPNERITLNRKNDESDKPKPWVLRTWTDIAGNKKTARLKTLAGTTVVLLFRNKPLEVPYDQLSDEDQIYIRERLIERGQQGLLAAIDGPAERFAAAPARPNHFLEADRQRDEQVAERQRQQEQQRLEFEERVRQRDEDFARQGRERGARQSPIQTAVTPPPAPTPTYEPPQVQTTRVLQCQKCNRQMTSVPENKKCPGCGVTFAYIENEDGTRTSTGAGGSFRFPLRGIKGIIVAGLFVGGIIAGVFKWLLGD